ncbi:MAG: D-2-hydroxyacid dehydrogenase [Oscillospiraceae bacterium]|jgi:glycerate dehydrogenase|nr:D-2-hydroxyacid dehydrogenase [Oscillospiraceae bacterium]
MKIVILDGYAENPGDLSWEPLRAFGEYSVYDRTPKEKVIERSAGADIVVTNKTPLPKETLARLPNLKFIALLSTGYNVVDIAYAKERGIPVSNIPSYSTHAVAQLVFAFILGHYNHVALHSEAVHAGEWSASPDFCFWKADLFELAHKTFGVIGYGEIGRRAAKIADAFGMRVIVTSRTKPAQLPEYVTFTDQGTLLKNADVVSLHCPLTPQTQGMVNEEFLAKMKPTALLINTARGPLVDEAALAKALCGKTIAGAGLDVLSSEPPEKDNPLFGAPNCLITPHIAWAGKETRARLMSIFLDNIKAFTEGGPIHVVNP